MLPYNEPVNVLKSKNMYNCIFQSGWFYR